MHVIYQIVLFCLGLFIGSGLGFPLFPIEGEFTQFSSSVCMKNTSNYKFQSTYVNLKSLGRSKGNFDAY